MGWGTGRESESQAWPRERGRGLVRKGSPPGQPRGRGGHNSGDGAQALADGGAQWWGGGRAAGAECKIRPVVRASLGVLTEGQLARFNLQRHIGEGAGKRWWGERQGDGRRYQNVSVKGLENKRQLTALTTLAEDNNTRKQTFTGFTSPPQAGKKK